MKPLSVWLEKLQNYGIGRKKAGNGTLKTRSEQSLRVVHKDYPLVGGRVYNMTTERTHVYYANGVLNHNCDSLQYACLHADNGSAFGAKHVSSRKEIKPYSFAYV